MKKLISVPFFAEQMVLQMPKGKAQIVNQRKHQQTSRLAREYGGNFK
jgi:hypothetical protein